MVRRLILILGSLCGLASAQQVPDELVDPWQIAPQATVVVRKHETGADMVEITMLAQDYPLGLLREQAQRLGELLGSPPRGLYVYNTQSAGVDPRFAFVKAQFATDYLIDRSRGMLRLEPILRAFAGAPPPHTLRVIQINFDEEPLHPKILRAWRTNAVALSGRLITSPNSPLSTGIEYRIIFFEQDATKIKIPEVEPSDSNTPLKPIENQRPSLAIVVPAIVVASLAVGALVYFALLKASSKSKRR